MSNELKHVVSEQARKLFEHAGHPAKRMDPHATKVLRGLGGLNPPGTGQNIDGARFGRLFPELHAMRPPAHGDLPALLTQLGSTLPPDDGGVEFDNIIPAGFTYTGQFIDHDITFDPTSSLDKQNDPNALRDFRTPRFDLDNLYGGGPSDSPFMYDQNHPGKFLFGGEIAADGDGGDLPRNTQGVAILGDPRNDENLIVAQLHRTFMKFHGHVLDTLQAQGVTSDRLFSSAQQAVRWHYQWAIVHDFLPRICGQNVVDHVLHHGRKFYRPKKAFMPVEFSVAAYRFGHSMVRDRYPKFNVNFGDNGSLGPAPLSKLFTFTHVSGDIPSLFPSVPSVWFLGRQDWKNFFPIDEAVPPNPARAIDIRLALTLHHLPHVPMPNALAVRNLLRGASMGLPSGQAVAKHMGFSPLSADDLAKGDPNKTLATVGMEKETPLWYYILQEAWVQHQGNRLGDVGSRIVAEVFIGLLQLDPSSYLNATVHIPPLLPVELGALPPSATGSQPAPPSPGPSHFVSFLGNQAEASQLFLVSWKPWLPAKQPGTFTFADLIAFATQ